MTHLVWVYTDTFIMTQFARISVCIDLFTWGLDLYGVATISRLLKIIGLFCKQPYTRDYILQKRPIILRGLLIEATL